MADAAHRPLSGQKPLSERNPVAIVTGAARRIGRAIALDLHSQGWAVALHGRRSDDDLTELAATINADGGETHAIIADLVDADAVSDLVPAVCKAFGRAPSLLINNASIFEDDRLPDVTVEDFNRHIAVNARAPFMLSQALAKTLPEGQSGHIIHLIDQRVWRPNPTFFSYTASKMLLWDMTRTMAQALAPAIRVNAIGPGPTLQSIHQSSDDFAAEQANVPLERGPDTKDIITAVRFLLASPTITGQMVALDGGQHLAWKTPDITAQFMLEE